MISKTTMNILDDWDYYKDKQINLKEDWTKGHDEYLSEEWIKKKDIKKVWEKSKIMIEGHWDVIDFIENELELR